MQIPIPTSTKALKLMTRRLVERVQRRRTPIRTDHPAALSCIIASNEYGSYCVPKSSILRPCAQMIMQNKVWEPDTLNLMRRKCGAGDIIHAGTYFGDFLPALASALHPDALLWAFEPSRQHFRCASITIELNDIGKNVRLTHAALGEHRGEVTLSSVDDAGTALGGLTHISERGSEITPLLALDDFIPPDRPISILQLDVEGFEEAALKGAETLIRRNQPILIVETPPQTNWFTALLHDCGYSYSEQVSWNSVYIAAP